MEFGKVDETLIDSIDFSLPQSSEKTIAILNAAKGSKKGIVKVGCSNIGRKEWIGTLYPTATKERDKLKEYVKQFNCVEMNATFYQIHSDEAVLRWASEAPNEFLFCPKFYQGITHFKRFKNVEDLTSLYLKSISNFGKHLGPTFLQLPDNFNTNNFELLTEYLLSLPKDLEVFVELRHMDWYTTGYKNKIFNFLAENRIGWLTTDTTGRRDVLHTELPIPKAFIRFVGNNLHTTDYSRIQEWVEQIKIWLDLGIQEVYLFLHQMDEANTPIFSEYVIDQINEKCNLSIPVPHLIKQ